MGGAFTHDPAGAMLSHNMDARAHVYKTRPLPILGLLLLPLFILFVFTKMNTEGGTASEMATVAALGIACVASVIYGLSMLTISVRLGADALVYRRTGREWTIPYAAVEGWKYNTQHFLLDIDNSVKNVHVYFFKDVAGLMRELERKVGHRGEVEY